MSPVNWLERLTELRKPVYSLDYCFITKDMKGHESTARGRGRGLKQRSFCLDIWSGAWWSVKGFWFPSLEALSSPVFRFIFFIIYLFIYFVFCPFTATPAAYGGSQARGLIGAVAAGLHHSHSNTRSELHLRPTPQLREFLNP